MPAGVKGVSAPKDWAPDHIDDEYEQEMAGLFGGFDASVRPCFETVWSLLLAVTLCIHGCIPDCYMQQSL